MRFFQRTTGILSTTALFACLLACSPGKDNPTADGGQNQSSNQAVTQHSFKCSAPNLLQGLAKGIHFDGDRASEESEPYVGAFSTEAVSFEMQSGIRELVKLDESMYFTSIKPGIHDGCEKFNWYKAGTLVFLEFLGAGGNPYPPQQLLFLDEASQAFKSVAQLHPLLGQDFIEFEKNGCLAGLRHGDGLAHRICFQDSALVLKNALLEERYQANAWHTFLCDFSDGRVNVSEYRVKSSVLDETTELDPLGSMQKMLLACDLFLAKFKEQATVHSSKRGAN